MNATETKPVAALPYSVKSFPYGYNGRMMPTKVYADGHAGELLTPEELAVWDRLEWLATENARLIEERDRLRADLDVATALVDAKKGKGGK